MNLTERAQSVLEEAVTQAKKAGNPELQPSHVLGAACSLNEEIIVKVIALTGITMQQFNADFLQINNQLPRTSSTPEPYPGNSFNSFLEEAEKFRKEMGDEYISVEHYLLAGVNCKQISVTDLFKKYKLTTAILKKYLSQVRGNNKVNTKNPEANIGVLEKYARDLTELAKQGKLDPVIGRDTEIRRVIQILSRRTKNNPVIIGEPGVGKTAIAEGLALRIIRGDVPENLKNRQLISLDVSSLVAGAKFRGEFEERLKAVLKAVQDSAGQIILFIDEIHTIVNAGHGEGAVDAGNMLKPALARGELRCIGATTLDEYRIIEKDRALERRFQPVFINPPSVEDTITILRGLKERYEIHHGVRIKDAALIAASTLSDRYITERFLPDKAIDLIDESASRLKIQLDSVPENLDSCERKLAQLKMELAAIEKDTDAQSLERALEVKQEIKSFTEQANTLRLQWESAKKEATDINEIKKQIESAKLKLEEFERRAEYAKASEIKFGELPKLTAKLEQFTSKISSPNKQNGNTILLKEEVTAEDIAQVVSAWTGIPLSKLFSGEKEKLLNLEKELEASVIGQEQALTAVANAIRLSRSGLKDPNKPTGSFLFLGPTGVGKTETAKTLARILFDTEKAMVRIDMSEYMEEHTVAKLIGSPPGYIGYEEGGQLTEAIRRKPYSLVLFDEIEKAHPKVLNILLQMLDDGRLTDSHGRVVDFRNSIIILTSNIAAHEILEAAGNKLTHAELKQLVMQEVLKYLRPELLNRIDESIVFNPITREGIEKIVGIQLGILKQKLEKMHLTLLVSPEVISYLAETGYDPLFGARPLKRVIQEKLEVPLSSQILAENYREEDTIKVELQKNALVWKKITQ